MPERPRLYSPRTLHELQVGIGRLWCRRINSSERQGLNRHLRCSAKNDYLVQTEQAEFEVDAFLRSGRDFPSRCCAALLCRFQIQASVQIPSQAKVLSAMLHVSRSDSRPNRPCEQQERHRLCAFLLHLTSSLTSLHNSTLDLPLDGGCQCTSADLGCQMEFQSRQ